MIFSYGPEFSLEICQNIVLNFCSQLSVEASGGVFNLIFTLVDFPPNIGPVLINLIIITIIVMTIVMIIIIIVNIIHIMMT